MLENRVLFHAFLKCIMVLLLTVGEDSQIDFFEATQRVHWASFPFRCLKEVFSSWVKSLVWILSRSSSASATGWWISKFTVRTLRMLLLHVGVEGWIGKIGLVAVLALEVTALVVIL